MSYDTNKERAMKDNEPKQSDAGITGGTNGATGGATKSDLERGYMDAEVRETYEPFSLPEEQGGFLDRPNGWAR